MPSLTFWTCSVCTPQSIFLFSFFLGNNIDSITRLLVNFTSLEVLHLRNNNMISIHEHVGRISTLKELVLDDNKLEELPESFTSLRNLETLKVSNNRLKALPEEIGRMRMLVNIFADNNKIAVIPSSMCKLSKLKFLHLSNNKISEIPVDIDKWDAINITLDTRHDWTLHIFYCCPQASQAGDTVS